MEMYNYNGVKLPALPEWDKTAYPYAIIYYVANETGVEEAHFGYSNQPFYLNTTYGIVTNTEGATIYASIYDAETKAWGEMYLFYEAAFALEPSKVIWINEKMLDDTGEEFMDKSEPEKLFPRRWWTNLLLAGLCSRHLPVSVREPVAYLYNGVRLPPLPEWDEVKYPYVAIRNASLGFYELLCSNVEFVHTSGTSCNNLGGEHISCSAQRGTSTEWTTFSGPEDGKSPLDIVWTSIDILSSDKTVYLAASEPVPVYE